MQASLDAAKCAWLGAGMPPNRRTMGLTAISDGCRVLSRRRLACCRFGGARFDIAIGLQKVALNAASKGPRRYLIYTHSEAQDALRIRMIDHRQDGTRKDSVRSEKTRFGGFLLFRFSPIDSVAPLKSSQSRPLPQRVVFAGEAMRIARLLWERS
ncbi:hypothetical protein CXL00_11735 [Stutzerimonas stutzeri]|uniref:Uncharacterized protein n=1 Tax=Stutzerimonas stutzeri TaxID=316 RepID=A0A2N8SSC5_STUST|nr:hypothetical protein CXL00_11735 [Stutzerimonas stutzeri]